MFILNPLASANHPPPSTPFPLSSEAPTTFPRLPLHHHTIHTTIYCVATTSHPWKHWPLDQPLSTLPCQFKPCSHYSYNLYCFLYSHGVEKYIVFKVLPPKALTMLFAVHKDGNYGCSTWLHKLNLPIMVENQDSVSWTISWMLTIWWWLH